ncbi:hypothetical protein C8Q75DRAFT_805386 [Abortiporus biennis]|nr:hypothetical protein C8Q75DRAFT_805386 [Abortiporus biennis]
MAVSVASSQRHGLPQELVDNIVDHLHNDKTALLNCSHAARALLYPSHFHLFHDVTIDWWDNPKTQAQRDIEDFDRFLHTYPSTSVFIHSLEVKPDYGVGWLTIDVDTLVSSVAALPRLHTLSLSCVSLNEMPTHPQTPSYPLRLQHLRLDGVDFSDINVMHYFFSLFSEIDELEISSCDIERWANVEDSQYAARQWSPSPLRVNKLVLGPDNSDKVFMYLEALLYPRLYPNHALRSLTVVPCQGNTDFSHMNALGGTIAESGTFIDSLEFDIRPLAEDFSSTPTFFDLARGIIPSEIWNTLHLSRCTSLTSLTLHVDIVSSNHDGWLPSQIWNSNIDILSTASPDLQTLTLVFHPFFPSNQSIHNTLSSINWQRLDECLSRFKSLNCLELRVPRREQDRVGDMYGFFSLNRQLSFSQRGLLRITTL